MPLKLRNRAVETLLTAWAEPWSAFGARARSPRRTTCARARVARAVVQPGARLDRRLFGRPRARAHGRPLRRRRRPRARHDATRAGTTRGRERHPRHAVARRAGHRGVQRVGRGAHRRRAGAARRVPAVARQRHPLRHAPARNAVVPRRHGRTAARPGWLRATTRPACVSFPGSADSTWSSSRPKCPRSGAATTRSRPPSRAPDEVDDGREIEAGGIRVDVGRRRVAVGHARRPHVRRPLRHRGRDRPRRLLRLRSRPRP